MPTQRRSSKQTRELAKLKNINHTLNDLKKEFPKFKLVKKSNSVFMKILNVLLRIITLNFQKYFMTNYVTTINNTIYVPSSWDNLDDRSKIVILRHERIHLVQKKKYTFFLFTLLYLFLPFPMFFAYFRTKFEKEAYEETIRVKAALYGRNSIRRPEFKSFLVKQFTTPMYGWMWIFKGSIENWATETIDKYSK
tara:strand:+ start:2102 stop:2683 length:582 start_codon:yes stop_codon:yes gene_type:complete